MQENSSDAAFVLAYLINTRQARSTRILAKGRPDLNRPLPRASRCVESADGARLAVQEWGCPASPAILFIHGGLQSHRCWHRQFADPFLSAAFRLVTFDLRGHGESGKPEGDRFYRPAAPWADDIAAIMAALGLVRPTLVGWSFGGRVIGDYLGRHGPENVGAVAFAAAATTSDLTHFGPGIEALDRAGSPDPVAMARGTAEFIQACFHRPPPPEEMAETLAYNMAVPLHVRHSMRGRLAVYDDVLRTLNVPALALHGAQDQVLLPSLTRHTAALVRGCKLCVLPGVGHSPFREDASRFNRELAVLAARATRPIIMEA